MSFYIEHHNWKETRLGIPKSSLFDIFYQRRAISFLSASSH